MANQPDNGTGAMPEISAKGAPAGNPQSPLEQRGDAYDPSGPGEVQLTSYSDGIGDGQVNEHALGLIGKDPDAPRDGGGMYSKPVRKA
jgi:hypothetical protein